MRRPIDSGGLMRLRLPSLLILAFCSTGFAQGAPDYKADGGWEQVCKQSEAQPLTVIQPVVPLVGDQLIHCDETALYYGLDKKPDYAAALQCGWFQRAHPQDTVGNMFYGPGVLTMLYANGRSVPQNYDLAIRFVCENRWASPAEMAYRVGHLEHLRNAGSSTAVFDLCDDITSGLSDGFCTSIRTRAADAARAKKIDEILKGLAPSAKSLFPSLQAAESAFEKARTEGEIDLSGTSRGAFQLIEEAILRDQFLINLQRFGRADIPATSEADLSLLDLNLNQTYQKIQHLPASKWEFGTIKPDGIRVTERTWISLVDAWIHFAQIAYPNLSTTQVRAQLIRLRLHQLRSLYKE
jgi:hypothetical protein